MSAPTSASPSPGPRLASRAWWLLLVAATGVLSFAAHRRVARVDALTQSPSWSVDAPGRDATSATGLAGGQRQLIVPGHHAASFRWIMEAQEAAHDGRWRLRQIRYDAPAGGRVTHRTSPYRWWLITVGWLRGVVTGEPLGLAIEQGARWADPLLFGLLLIGGAVYVARCYRPLAAAVFAVAAVSLFPLSAAFQPGAPDPHALAWVLALGSLLPLFAPPVAGRSRRGHFIAAGVCGGLGFWNDAATQSPVLLAILLGGVGAALLRRGAVEEAADERACRRIWAIAGALTTLAASLFEFAPRNFSWSLDAVSPVHAFAWWAGGELIVALLAWKAAGAQRSPRRLMIGLGVVALALAAWAIAAWRSHTGLLLASDFYARELANDPHGGTAANLAHWLHQAADAGRVPVLLSLALGVLLAVGAVWRGSTREERSRLARVLVAAAVFAGLGCVQLRWWSLFDVALLTGIAMLLAAGARPRLGWAALVVVLVSPGLFLTFPPALEHGQVKDITPVDAEELVARDFSYWLARRNGAEPPVLLSTPMFSSAAAYYGGFLVITSTDEENKTGYLTATRIATANTLDEASVLIRTRGITRVALPLWDPMLPNLVRAGRNLAADAPLPDDALLVGLLRWGSPVWMRAMNYQIPAGTGLQDFQLAVYAVQGPMDEDLFLSRLADFFVERGSLPDAESLSRKLQDYPRSLAALGAIANVALAKRDTPRVTETVDRLIPYLSRIVARHLPPDRRITIAFVLAQTGHADLAREQVRLGVNQLDAANLRPLSPAAVKKLLWLARTLGVDVPDATLREALELLPPADRARFVPAKS